MKRSIIFSLALTAALISCKKETAQVGTLTASFDVVSNPCYVGDEVHFINTSTGGSLPYTCTWTIEGSEKTGEDVKYTFTANGTYTVSLKVVDGSGQSAVKNKLVVVNPSPVALQGSLEVVWAAKTDGYNSISTPAVSDDGSVYAVTQANKLYKFDSQGNRIWAKDIFTATDGITYASPSVDTDGTVFIAGGTVGPNGTVKAFNADGSVKWTFSQWYAKTGTPSPTYQASLIAITDNNVYFGHTGTNGCVMSANKATGARNGFCAPAGGARTGIALTKNGEAGWYAGVYGLQSIKTSTLDSGGDSPVNIAWSKWSSAGTLKAKTNMMCGIAVLDVDGQPSFAGTVSDAQGTRIYVVRASDGEYTCEYYIPDAADQDQGGVVVTKEGYLVASLNYTAGKENGGVIVYDPASKSVVGTYNVQEKVAGSAAVDQAGNIHFGTESGYYYVIDSQCNILVKADIASIAAATGKFTGLRKAKIWSSVVIGDDGKVYLQFTDDDDRSVSGLLAFKVKSNSGEVITTAPADSQWPMYGRDRRHTNVQK